ncbi:MAG TPA: hypothetical protein VFR17_02855 [Mycobacterium sp.]|nr:hypothetical protein [Mycobacterium sp.]
MKHYIVGGLAAAVTAGALIVSAPPASAGCQPYKVGQLCDGPIQPDGTWQRCEDAGRDNRSGSFCYPMGGDHAAPPFQPAGHIDP